MARSPEHAYPSPGDGFVKGNVTLSTEKAMCADLGLAPGTIRSHMHSMRKKVGAHDKLALLMKVGRLTAPELLSNNTSFVSREIAPERAA